MKQRDVLTAMRELAQANSEHLQKIANLKKSVQELTEMKNQLTKKLQFLKLSIEEKEKVLFAPYMEPTDTQQKTLFE